MSQDVAQQALSHWGISDAKVTLIAQRENTVFRVKTGTSTDYALRLHRPGYQSTAAIRSELDWMRHLGRSGIQLPTPVPLPSGALMIEQGGYCIDLLSWLDGEPLGKSGVPLDLRDRTGVFLAIGQTLAQIHDASDSWSVPDGFTRPSWGLEGLLGDEPLWGRFWENPALSAEDAAILSRVRQEARAVLQNGSFDFGLIHADFVRENVLINRTTVQVIDFDDCCFGYRLFDVATALIKNRREPDYPDLESALLQGYGSVRELDKAFLPLFMLLRALTYVGWIVPRLHEPGGLKRQESFLQTAMPLAQDFLDQLG